MSRHCAMLRGIPPQSSLPRAAQSSAYLNQALEALTAASSAPTLYAEIADYYHGSLLESSQRRLSAMNRRLSFLRSAVLFAALSAEAYANEFLEAALPARDADALDRLPPGRCQAATKPGTTAIAGRRPSRDGAALA